MANPLPLAEHKNEHRDYNRAKSLRQSAPLAERLLWDSLRTTMKAYDFKFRRQHPISPYVVDFVCLKSRLIIEIDGPSHDARQHIDRSRDIYLQHMGYTILRFSNDDIYDNSEGVILQILHTAKGLSDEPYAPLP